MKKCIVIFTIVFFSITLAQDSGFDFPSGKEIEFDLAAKIIKRSSGFKYIYNIQTRPLSPQSISDFYLKTSSNIDSIESPTEWIGGFSNVFPSLYMWSSSNPECNLKGGAYSSVFSLISSNLPWINRYYCVGYFELPQVEDGEAPDGTEIIGGDILNNSVSGFTVSPNTFNNPIDIKNHIDSLLGFISISASLKWIKNNEKVEKYTKLVSISKSSLEDADELNAIVMLQTIVNEVEADSGESLTSEAYALLKYNSEYLIKQLPEFDLGDFYERLIQNIHQCYDKGSINNKGIYNSLIKKVNNSKKKYEQEKIRTAVNMLKAFQNELKAQKGKHLAEECYQLLKDYSAYLFDILRKNEN